MSRTITSRMLIDLPSSLENLLSVLRRWTALSKGSRAAFGRAEAEVQHVCKNYGGSTYFTAAAPIHFPWFGICRDQRLIAKPYLQLDRVTDGMNVEMWECDDRSNKMWNSSVPIANEYNPCDRCRLFSERYLPHLDSRCRNGTHYDHCPLWWSRTWIWFHWTTHKEKCVARTRQYCTVKPETIARTVVLSNSQWMIMITSGTYDIKR